MFTGLIEEIGTIEKISSIGNDIEFTIACNKILTGLKIGDSVAINGACQTVIEYTNSSFTVFATSETLKITNFSKLKLGDKVNLEKALRLSDGLDGHIVTGHIDGIAQISSIVSDSNTHFLTIELPENLIKQVVKKGSITIDGISLTIADANSSSIKLAIIPHTYDNTNLKYKKINDTVNIETDIIAKYIEKYLYSNNNNTSNISMDLLERNGFL